MIGRALIGLYGLASGLLEPLALNVLRKRAARGKEASARLGERLGQASVARPAGSLVWLHGVSVGESLSLLTMVERLRQERPDIAILVTSGTVTSAAVLARRLPPGVIHQYAPIDGPAAVRRFLDHWRPSLALIAESELWPNLITAARRRGIRLALVSARITERSARGWARTFGAARTLLSAFDLILPQDAESAGRLARLGATPGPLLNLKHAGAPLPVDDHALAELRIGIRARIVVLAASTHEGEEAFIRAAFSPPPGVLLILAPRHPDRADAAAEAFAGLAVARRSLAQPVTKDTEVYLADTLGEMGLFFALADVVVMGGAFRPEIGGHNPLEPARFGKPIISGDAAYNFHTIYAEMLAKDACILTRTEEELAEALRTLLNDPARAARLGEAARAYAERQTAAADAAVGQVLALLPGTAAA